MTRRAPIARTTSAGTLFIMPPSTSMRPSRSTGGKTSGSDIVARIAVASEPRSMTTGVARQQIDGHRAERRRQLVEGLDLEIRRGDPADQQVDLLAVVERGRRDDAARQAELEPRRIGARVGLAADVLEREARGAEHLVPVHALRASRRSRSSSCRWRTRRRSGRPCWCRRPRRSGCDALRTSGSRRRARCRARCRRRTRRRRWAVAPVRQWQRAARHAQEDVRSRNSSTS